MMVSADIVGLSLCRVIGDDLRMTEAVRFTKGAAAVDTVLRRARLSGQVGPIGDDVDLGDYWADLRDANGSIVSHVVLDAGSFRALKRQWLRLPYA
jgi:hypothetical protein